MFKTYRVGTLFGFPIEVNASFLIMLAVFALFWGLAGLIMIPIAFGSVLLHELGHALMARHLGVRMAGIELHFFGGAAKMIDQPKSADDEIAIAAAGPAVSFALGGLGFVLASLTGIGILQVFGWLNLILGAFNLVPALPMDGGRILRAFLSKRMSFLDATRKSIKVSRVFAIALGAYGLFTLQLYLALLAGVLWMMGSAELKMAQVHGYGGSFDVPPWRPGAAHGPATRVYRPVATAFTIRAHNGRLVIEPLD